jgi:hypothetical protein
VLAVYEMFKDQVNPQALITEYVNALPNTVLNPVRRRLSKHCADLRDCFWLWAWCLRKIFPL